ncbi:MAG: hypothetical protein M1274_02280 [Actinobacteria bacterium]|nr:hypothetical protein [Actinomycetota bacterium]
MLVLDRQDRAPAFNHLRCLSQLDGVILASDGPDFPHGVSFLTDPSLPGGIRICDGKRWTVYRVPREGWYAKWLKDDVLWRERMLVAAANGHNLDILVFAQAPIDVPFFSKIYEAVNILTAEQALPYVTLFLRTRGIYVLDCRSVPHLINAGGFYWELMRALLPASWPWFSSCLAMEKQGRPIVARLGQSVLQRVDQALRARDRLLVQSLRPQDNDTRDEIRFYLDVMMLTLSGAVDSLALVIDDVYGLGSRPINATFRNREWRKKLRRAAPGISAALECDGARHQHSLELLACLRNTIHRAAIETMAMLGPARTAGTCLFLEADAHPDVRRLMHDAGVEEAWTIDKWADGAVLVDAVRCAETLIVRIPAFIDRVMSETVFPSAAGAARRIAAPTGAGSPDPSHLRWLAGIKPYT